ncbi:outer membrane beta-barrel protein [Sphingobacterium hungaricum]|nr:outer membrane beta-barrel protein [Sphingobacterium hungaricum]
MDKFFAIRGLIIDSVSHDAVKSATISLYNNNNNLIKYGLSNLKGEFELKDVQYQDTVILKISHLSYNIFILKIAAPSDGLLILKNTFLTTKTKDINEIVIEKPPILLNKDTLEIYPEAFDLGENTVIEDLLKKVPGIVVWGDGQITVNGKKVTKLLVEGKKFFGTDPLIATRNLPNNAVSKITVYENPKPETSENSTLSMDITLKNNNKSGVFGKVGAGIGDTKRKETAGSLNFFNKKNQISLFAAQNNTNKEAYTVGDFLRVNTYMPGGEDYNSYSSSFNKIGYNEFLILGSRFERSWTKNVNSELDVLNYIKNATIEQESNEIYQLEIGSQDVKSNSTSTIKNQVFKANNDNKFKFKNREFKVNSKIYHTIDDLKINLIKTISQDSKQVYLIDNANSTRAKNLDKSLYLNYNDKGLLGRDKVNVFYEFRQVDKVLNQNQHLIFVDSNYTSETLNRTKINDVKRLNHNLFANIEILSAFGKISKWRLNSESYFALSSHTESQIDRHFNQFTQNYDIVNGAISFNDDYREFHWRPGLKLSRSFIEIFGRGSNEWGSSAMINYETTMGQNRSSSDFRTIKNNFKSILPSADIYYTWYRSGKENSLILNYNTNLIRPQLYQQVSLLDTTQKDFNYVGNKDLTPEYNHVIEFKFNNRKIKNSFNQNLTFRYTLRKDQLADSSIYQNDGLRKSYTVNIKGTPCYSLNYDLLSSTRIFGKPLNMKLFANFTGEKGYYYINESLINMKNYGFETSFNFDYLPHDKITTSIKTTNSKQFSQFTNYANKTTTNILNIDAVIKLPMRTTFINSISFIDSKISRLENNQQYLWNIHLYHRFFKKERFEIKFSMFDLLSQKSSVKNYISGNMIKQEINNNLEQYFMFSLSYFPRKF